MQSDPEPTKITRVPNVVSDDERRRRLAHWEKVIDEQRKGWLFEAQAFTEIRRDGLFALRGYTSFAAYVRARYNRPERYCNDLIAAYAIAHNVRDVSNDLSARAMITLGRAPKAKQPELLSEAIKAAGNRSPTAKQIAAVIAPHVEQPKRRRANEKLRVFKLKGGHVLRIILKRPGTDLRSLLLEALAKLPETPQANAA